MKAEKGISDTNSLGSETESADKMPISADKMPIIGLSAQQKIIFRFVEEKGQIASHQAGVLIEVRYMLKKGRKK